MKNYSRLGISIFEQGELVPEAPFFAKVNDKDSSPLKYRWVKSGAPCGYTMPLYYLNAKDLVSDCAHFASVKGQPLTNKEKEKLLHDLTS